jgi:transposase
MWRPYLDLIERHCTQALNILDRFHLVAKLNLALDEVRAGEARHSSDPRTSRTTSARVCASC